MICPSACALSINSVDLYSLAISPLSASQHTLLRTKTRPYENIVLTPDATGLRRPSQRQLDTTFDSLPAVSEHGRVKVALCKAVVYRGVVKEVTLAIHFRESSGAHERFGKIACVLSIRRNSAQ